VVVPALLLTLALEWIGIKWFPHSYNSIFDQYQFARIGAYIPLWLSFSSEFWGLNEPILTNSPFWSLCFEVWFYIFLALFLFTRGLSRIIAIGAVAVLVGPKICIFFPLWGIGVLAYYLQHRITLTPWPARILLVLSIACYPLLKVLGLDDMATRGVNAAFHDWPRTHLQMAWQFPGYFPIALCVGGSILGMRFGALRQVARIGYPVGLAASFTFTIYLTHLPLLKFFVALGGSAIDSMLWPALATLAFVVVLGSFTERRIGPWRSAFTLLVRCGDKLASRAAIAVRNG
jgi:peptidoglycan/LPS O-acetylase OafA/YrhL